MATFRRWLPILVIGVLTGGLYAKNLKIKDLMPIGGQSVDNPDGDGMVKIRVEESPELRSEVNVHITHFKPNTTYGVQIEPGGTVPLALTTNPAGNGSWTGVFEGIDITQNNVIIRIFVWDGIVGTISSVSFDELAAIGCSTGNCPIGEPCSVDADCDDGGLCTIDTCNGGFCFHALEQCDDGNPCTADFCNPFDGSCDNDAIPNCP